MLNGMVPGKHFPKIFFLEVSLHEPQICGRYHLSVAQEVVQTCSEGSTTLQRQVQTDSELHLMKTVMHNFPVVNTEETV